MSQREQECKEVPSLRSIRADINLPVVGLENLHNTCYFNSILQCFMRIQPLTFHLLYNDNNSSTSSGNESLVSCYTSFLKSVIQVQHSRTNTKTTQTYQTKVIKPTELLYAVKSSFPTFDNFNQHDPHEFCYFFINSLHQQLLERHVLQKRNKYQQLKLQQHNLTNTNATSNNQHLLMIQYWKNHVQSNKNSFIVDHIQGLLQNNLQCPTPNCYNKSSSFDIYSILSLPIPKPNRLYHYNNKDNGISIQECINELCKSTTLDNCNLWYCDKCQQYVNAKQHIQLCSIPNILILHLQRFHSGSSRQKNTQQISFPIDTTLDMKPFLYNSNTPRSSPLLNSTAANNNTHHDDNNFQYKLFGVCNHEGQSINSGHYTSIVRVDQGCSKSNNDDDIQGSHNHLWYKCNDSKVECINFHTKYYTQKNNNVTSGTPYLLFYERINNCDHDDYHGDDDKDNRNKKEVDEDGFTLIVSKKTKNGKKK